MSHETSITASIGMPVDARLTVLLPIRASGPDDPIIDRLDFALADDRRSEDVGHLVVDDGSPEPASEIIRKRCERNGFGYMRLDSGTLHFSVGRTRNFTAMYAHSPFIMFQDVDLVPYPGFYREVLNEIEVQRLHERASDFLMFGVIYLTERGTREFFDTPPDRRRQLFTHYLLLDDRSRIAKFSTGTSVNVHSREHFLIRGGNDNEFQGWGFEDLEFNARVIRRLEKYPEPRNWLRDFKNFRTIDTYEGWKSAYRLQGDLTFFKGLVLFHAWHPVEEHSTYMVRRAQNQRLFERKMRQFVEHREEPPPLPDKTAGRTLLFRTNAFVYSRDITPKLGDVVVASEDDFASEEELLSFLREREISRVLFHNPYVNDRMRMLYRACRERQFPYVVAERGALPGAVFYDPRGFNADSESYSPEHWDEPLSAERRTRVMRYIDHQRTGDEALEQQGPRLGANGLRRELDILPHEKVLFVPLQRPHDTVIEHQAGPIGSFDGFVDLVREVTYRVGREWRVVIKPHPLEDEVPPIPGALVAENANIRDLLELADAVLLINSGCGVLSMLWNKPVIVAGSAYYSHEGLTREAHRPDDVLSILDRGWRPDREKVLRFLSYLIDDFYSFGDFVTRETRMPDGTRMTATTHIEFQVIRGLPGGELRLRTGEPVAVDRESILFDRYRGDDRLPTIQEREERPMTIAGRLVRVAESAAGTKGDGGAGAPPKQRSSDLPVVVRKMRKLKRDPVRFLADSRSPVLRALGNQLIRNGQTRLPDR